MKAKGILCIAVALCMFAFTGCNSNDGPQLADGDPSTGGTPGAAAPAPTKAATGDYNPEIDPGRFSHRVTNFYFPLKPGTTQVSTGVKDGVRQLHEATVTYGTRVVIGVRCAIVRDIVTASGELVEKTSDWYAQDADGNVWYFGEASADYQNGAVSSTKGSWEAGIDGAKPGIVMQADPRPGPAYYQEYRPGIAEDRGKVLRTGETLRMPLGTFRDVIVIHDTNPLDPTLEQNKWYAPGVGLIQTIRTGSSHRERTRLIDVRKG